MDICILYLITILITGFIGMKSCLELEKKLNYKDDIPEEIHSELMRVFYMILIPIINIIMACIMFNNIRKFVKK